MDLFLSNYGQGGDLRDITIENNLFDTPGSHAAPISKGYYGISFSGNKRTITNVRIAYNSLLSASIPGFDSSAAYRNITVEANVGSMNQWFCAKGVTYAYNVWTNAKCGASDTTAPSGFVDPSHYDFKLAPDAAAIGHGDPGDHPQLDIDGGLRPVRAPSDAGAYQRESAQIVFGKSIGAAVIGRSESSVTAFYGKAPNVRTVQLARRPVRQLVYPLHGGALSIMVDRGRVVGVTTTSAYYRTAGRLGAASGIAPVRKWSGVRWIACRGAYRRSFGGVPVYVTPKGGRSGTTIAEVSMIKGDAGTCGRH
jgi:hypothetical protein